MAQVTSDGSLSTTVERSDTESIINGGVRAGDNLFHSFRNFSVPESGSASFNNAESIVNIFNRVTGGRVSQIDGLIQAEGAANFFLINPAGIVFGEGSSLKIGGSFYGGTTESILFPDGIEFGTSNLDADVALSINAPIGFNLREDSGVIINRSLAVGDNSIFPVGLEVKEGKSIALEANQIRFESGLLTAPGGSINLRALGDIAIAGNTLDSSLDTISRSGDGGTIEVNSSEGRVTVTEANIRSDSFAQSISNGGQINIFARQGLFLEDSTLTSSADLGTGGSIVLESGESVEFIDTRLDTGAFGDLRSGDIDITALNRGTVNFLGREDDSAQILTDAFGSGAELEDGQTGGDLTITAGNITIDNYFLVSRVNDSSLNLNTQGSGGNITISGDNIEIINNSAIETQTFGSGAAGSILVQGSNLILDNATIEASNRPPGNVEPNSAGGNIELQFTGIVSLSDNSSIIAEAENNASGGNIAIDSQFIVAFPSANDGNDIIARAQAGRGGNINLRTESIFNLENRISQPNNGTNDIDASSELGIDGNVVINTIAVNRIPGIVGLSVDFIDADKAIAYSCEAETGTSGLAINGKGGTPQSPSAPLNTENIRGADNYSSYLRASDMSVEIDNDTIDLAMGAIIHKNGAVSLVSNQTLANQFRNNSLSNCI
ncbi:MAG: filamentous hemagglutinin N-terminal domain-containing protein [Cyanobacteria bacterium J06600_6]